MNNNNTTYHPLGDYIRKIDKRNRDLALTKPMGINIDKQFMPSVANVIGTDMSNYKLVGKNQFACNLMHVGRDGKIPVAINTTEKEILVSPAYHVFEIVDKNALSPDFLMMWFHREEFDREASFYTDADVRSGMDFKALMEMRIPVPPISEQRAIVADYEAVARRIAVAKRTIATLQATAQTLYRKMFVDGIDKENLPEGWKWGTLTDVAKITMGQSPDGETYNEVGNGMIFYQGRTDFGFRFPSIRMYTTDPTRFAKKGDVLLSVRAPVGDLNIAPHDCCIGRGLASIREKHNCQSYIYYLLMNLSDVFNVSDGDGTIFGSITKDELYGIKVIVPEDNLIREFDEQCAIIDKQIELHSKEIEKLTEIQTIILSGMGR